METINLGTGDTKLCTLCVTVKPVSEFYYSDYNGRYSSWCKRCSTARVCKWQKENKDKLNAKNAKWKRENRDKVNDSNIRRLRSWTPERRAARNFRNDLKKLYNVTPEWWDAKLAKQGGGCGICGAKTSGAKGRRPHVDHCHETDKNRGILCHACNVCLHILERIPDWPEKARAYLDVYHRETGASRVGCRAD